MCGKLKKNINMLFKSDQQVKRMVMASHYLTLVHKVNKCKFYFNKVFLIFGDSESYFL